MVNEQIKQQRKEMRKLDLDWIAEEKDFKHFFTHVKVVFMHLGLLLKDEARAFLETRNWTDSSRVDQYMKEIEEFFEVYIK